MGNTEYMINITEGCVQIINWHFLCNSSSLAGSSNVTVVSWMAGMNELGFCLLQDRQNCKWSRGMGEENQKEQGTSGYRMGTGHKIELYKSGGVLGMCVHVQWTGGCLGATKDWSRNGYGFVGD